MAIESHFPGDQPSRYKLLNSSETTSNRKPATTQPWQTEKPKAGYIGSFISAEDLHQRPHSYMIVPHAPSEIKSLPKNTKSVVRWSRIILLILRICSWLGTAGILVCVVCIRPAGDAMDWFLRIPPPLALLHLSYTVYYLSRSTKVLDATTTATTMTMASILDACFIPCLGLYVVLARNQLSDTLDAGTSLWTPTFDTKFQIHDIVYSLYLLSLSTGGLLVVCFCFSIILTIQFRRIARLPPDMNPLQKSNLTARRHRKAATSASTIGTVETSIMAEDISFSRSPALAGLMDKPDLEQKISEHTRSSEPSEMLAQETGRNLPYTAVTRPNEARNSAYPSLFGEQKNMGQHAPQNPSSLYQTPPELRHLRTSTQNESKLGPIPVLPRPKYDFSNRSPRPLGLHPPTPRNETPEKRTGFDVRALRNIDGNSSAKLKSNDARDDVRLDVENAPVDQKHNKRHYGDIIGLGRVARNQARVVSSGVEKEVQQGMRARTREVSGKVAEEGRAGLYYQDF